MLDILAQSPVDPISGGAGWVGAGLLGLVLGWLLLIHLPGKDKFLKDLIETKDTQLNTVLENKWKSLDKMSLDFKDSLKQITDHCAAEMKTVTDFWKRELDIISGRKQTSGN